MSTTTLQKYIDEVQANFQEKMPDRDFSIGTYNYTFFVLPWANNLSIREEESTDVLNNMSINQILNNPDATDEQIDNILSNFNTERKEGSFSTGFVNIYFTGTQIQTIPQSATITCGSLLFTPTKSFVGIVGEVTEQDTEAINYISATALADNVYVFAIEVTSTTNVNTVIGPGAACTIDISSSFITNVETASTFSGGVLPETNEEYLTRAMLGMTAKAASGKDHIRAMLEDSELGVLDSAVFGMSDDLMIRDRNPFTGISTGGRSDAYVITSPAIQRVAAQLPATRSAGIWTMVIPSDIYAGVYAVTSVEQAGYTVSGGLVHNLGFIAPDGRPKITSVEDARYTAYQTLTITFVDDEGDAGDTERTYTANIAYMPNIASTQAYVEDIEVQSAAFDILVRAAVPISVSADISIQHQVGVIPPDEVVIQEAVANAVNGVRIGTSKLYTSLITRAVAEVFPLGSVQMPTRFVGISYYPDGTTGISTSNNYLEAPTLPGMSEKNTKYFCAVSDVHVHFVEGDACAQ